MVHNLFEENLLRTIQLSLKLVKWYNSFIFLALIIILIQYWINFCIKILLDIQDIYIIHIYIFFHCLVKFQLDKEKYIYHYILSEHQIYYYKRIMTAWKHRIYYFHLILFSNFFGNFPLWKDFFFNLDFILSRLFLQKTILSGISLKILLIFPKLSSLNFKLIYSRY